MPSARTIAIGDIHGCSRALAALLEAVRPEAADTVVTLGDYVDRGPDSRGVIDQLLRLATHCRLVPLEGNHEELLARAFADRVAIETWLRCGGVDALRSYGWAKGGPPRPLRDWFPEPHRQFLADCRPYYETATHVFVHAGLLPDLPLDRQPPAVLRWRVTDPAAAVPHGSGKVTVVGHTPQFGGDILDRGFLLAIDTNCVRGGWLTAVCIETGKVWQANQDGRLRPDPRPVRVRGGEGPAGIDPAD
jgi:serine/threonine protein phosphatase 1